MKLTLIAESQEQNSLGRAYCLWLLARQLGWSVNVLTTHGERIWEPLANSDFARDVSRVAADELESAVSTDTDLLIAVKPLPASLGEASNLAQRLRLPILVDIDDPDLEVRRRSGMPVAAALRWLRRPKRSLVDVRLARLARTLPSLVSNPWLQTRYGGTLIPHTRLPMVPSTLRDSSDLRVAFVGTRHRHKGVDVLRAAIDSLQSDGQSAELVITDDPPGDAKHWERWVGRTSLEEGLSLARDADVIAIPSLNVRHARGQLPVKLIDALMLGRAVIVSDVEPLPWAVGGAGLIVPAGDASALAEALRRLRVPATRRRLGDLAVRRAQEEFSIGVLAPRFEEACIAARSAGPVKGSA